MAISGSPGESKTARAEGLVATRYRFVQADSPTTVVSGPTSTGITNLATLLYKATVMLPAVQGDYTIQWDDGSGRWGAKEDVVVSGAASQTSFQIALGPWPVGTTVSLYLDRDSADNNGQPRGAVIQTQVVASDNSVTFTSIATNTRYIAAAQVSGAWRRVRFTT